MSSERYVDLQIRDEYRRSGVSSSLGTSILMSRLVDGKSKDFFFLMRFDPLLSSKII